MNKETYEALKRYMSDNYGKIKSRYIQDRELIKSWIDEVAKEYEE